MENSMTPIPCNEGMSSS